MMWLVTVWVGVGFLVKFLRTLLSRGVVPDHTFPAHRSSNTMALAAPLLDSLALFCHTCLSEGVQLRVVRSLAKDLDLSSCPLSSRKRLESLIAKAVDDSPAENGEKIQLHFPQVLQRTREWGGKSCSWRVFFPIAHSLQLSSLHFETWSSFAQAKVSQASAASARVSLQ